MSETPKRWGLVALGSQVATPEPVSLQRPLVKYCQLSTQHHLRGPPPSAMTSSSGWAFISTLDTTSCAWIIFHFTEVFQANSVVLGPQGEANAYYGQLLVLQPRYTGALRESQLLGLPPLRTVQRLPGGAGWRRVDGQYSGCC